MRVLSIHSDGMVRGGAAAVYLHGSALLREKGHETALFHIGETEKAICGEMPAYTLPEFRYENSWKKPLALASGFLYSSQAHTLAKRALAEFQPDIVHLHILQGHLSPSVLLPFYKAKIPIIQTQHDYRQLCPATHFLSHGEVCEACKGKKYHQAIAKRCRKGSLLRSSVAALGSYASDYMYQYDKMISAYIAPGEFLRQKMIGFGYAPEKITTLYNAYFGNIVAQTEIEREHILFVGRLSIEKGVDLLVRSAKDLGVPVHLAGDGPEREKLEKLAIEIGAENVRFLGFLNAEALRAQYRKALMMVLPSRWYENGPLVLLEAYANGTPVVGARIGAIPEFVEEGVTGYLFEPNNAEDLHQRLRNALSRRKNLRKMGEEARLMVADKFSPALYIEKLEEILVQSLALNQSNL